MAKPIEERAFEIFCDTARNASRLEDFFTNIFTRTEKIMLAKRLAIGYLILKEYDYRSISRTLKVSYGTIARMALIMNENSALYKALQKILLKQNIKSGLIAFINSFAPPQYSISGQDFHGHMAEHEKKKPF